MSDDVQSFLVRLKEGVTSAHILRALQPIPITLSRMYDITDLVSARRAETGDTRPDEEIFEDLYRALPPVEQKLYRWWILPVPENMDPHKLLIRLRWTYGIESADFNRQNTF
jgi:hypothetical protein